MGIFKFFFREREKERDMEQERERQTKAQRQTDRVTERKSESETEGMTGPRGPPPVVDHCVTWTKLCPLSLAVVIVNGIRTKLFYLVDKYTKFPV